jgi:hypothetical protein
VVQDLTEAEPFPVLDQTVQFLTHSSTSAAPVTEAIVEALLSAEKTAKQAQIHCVQLMGHWRLGFITGTQKSRQRAGVVLGAGWFIPGWIKIQLSYSTDLLGASHPDSSAPKLDRGTVHNSVAVGPLEFSLLGPFQFRPQKNILSFDFTRMMLKVSSLKLYEGHIRGGQAREVAFYQQPLKKQAFFSYFLVRERFMAARGRGGGLAIWTRI